MNLKILGVGGVVRVKAMLIGGSRLLSEMRCVGGIRVHGDYFVIHCLCVFTIEKKIL